MTRERYLKFLLWGFLSSVMVLFISDQAAAQNSMGAGSIAMGQTGVAVTSNWSAYSNVALMPTDENRVSFYGYRYAGISEITDMAVAVVTQSKWGTIGSGIHRYGFNLFSESRFRLSMKQNLDRFHYGFAVTYIHISQGGNYGSAGAFGFDLGLAADITERLIFGARATNLNQPSYGDTDEQLPREFAAGLSYLLTPEALLTADIVKDVMFPPSFQSGIQYEVIDSLFLRTGITTKPETYSFGFGYRTGVFDLNFALQQHNPLGLSPALDLSIRF